MKLSLMDIMIIQDTLLGSNSMVDGGMLFKYTNKARMDVWENIARELKNTGIQLTMDNEVKDK